MEIYISYEAVIFQLQKHLCSLFAYVSLCLEHLCVHMWVELPVFMYVSVSGCLSNHSQCRDEGDRSQDMEQAEGGMRHPQARGD